MRAVVIVACTTSNCTLVDGDNAAGYLYFVDICVASAGQINLVLYVWLASSARNLDTTRQSESTGLILSILARLDVSSLPHLLL